MNNHRTKYKTPVVFYVSLVLLFLCALTTHMTGNLYAKYSDTASGTSSAKVAKFNVNKEFVSANVDVDLNFYDPEKLKDEIKFKVSSRSEVTVKYNVTVRMPAGVDYSWLEVSLNSGTESFAVSENGNVFTFSDVGRSSPNDNSEHEYMLVFSIREDHYGAPGAATDISDSVTLEINAEQID